MVHSLRLVRCRAQSASLGTDWVEVVMKGSYRFSMSLRWLLLVAMSGFLPAFFLKCDKAALNLQRGFFIGLGDSFSDLLIDPLADG